MEEVKTVIDNTKDWYDLADTAVKIGLGAFIGGMFSYITTKSNHKYELIKEKRAYKIKILEEITTLLENYFVTSYNYLNMIYSYSTNDYINNINTLEEKQKNNHIKLDTNLIQDIDKLNIIRTKLHLIGIFNIDNLISTYYSRIIKLRNHISKGGTIPTLDEVKEHIDELKKTKDLILKEINTFFENLK